MNTISLIYLIAGLSLWVWPLATLFLKRRVMDAQWLEMLALTLSGLAIVVFSCLFNTFLNREYMLVLMWMILALFAPPMSGVAMASLTLQGGVTRKIRSHLIIAASVTALLLISEMVAGKPIYLTWISRSANGTTHFFYPSSWRYNLIVAIHHYLFNATLVVELLFNTVYSVICMRRLHLLLGEYYSSSSTRTYSINVSYMCIAVLCFMVALTVTVYPFNMDRPVWFVAVTCSLLTVAGLVLGGVTYFRNYGVERFSRERAIWRTGGDPARSGRALCEYIEKEGFRNPDLTVFDLATRFRLSQDDVVDIIHRLHGMTFSKYVDSLRVEQANSIIMSENINLDDHDALTRLAHRCGYVSGEDLRRAMHDIIGVRVKG